jgi:hypothetical protein
MPFTPFTVPAPGDANFANGALDLDIAHFLPYLIPTYVANVGTYPAGLFAAVPPYVLLNNNRVGDDYTTADAAVRLALDYDRAYARIQCIHCQVHPVPGGPCPSAMQPTRPAHRGDWFRCPQATVGAALHDFWGAACGSFACLGRAAAPNVPAPLELCDAILVRNPETHRPTGVNTPGAAADLNVGGGGLVDNARLVALEGLRAAAVAAVGNEEIQPDEYAGWEDWTADARAFHHALLRLQLDLYGFTTAAGALGNGEVGVATHASNWWSFDHFGFRARVAAVGGAVTVYTQKVTGSAINFYGNSLWDEGMEETVVKVTRVPATIAWVLSAMHA